MPLRGFLGGELCEVSGLSLDWSIQIKSVGVWLVGQGSFPRGTKTKVWGGTLVTRVVGEGLSGMYIYL